MRHESIDFRLASSDGWCTISFAVCEVAQIKGTKHVVLNVKSRSQFWDSVFLLRSGKYELTDAAETQVFRIVTPLTRLEELLRHFDEWLARQTAFQFTLSDNPDQFVQIELGTSSEFVSSGNRPVLKFKFMSSRFRMEAQFVTDQSCISSFVDGLKGGVKVNS